MLILGIDTSGHTASAAVCDGEKILAESFITTKLTQSQIILPLVQRVLSDSGHEINDIEAFAAVKGPGSYTGLRIGIAAVKGLCFGLDKKCSGVSSLMSLAYNFKGTAPWTSDCIIFPVMHARQDLVYNAAFRMEKGTPVREREDGIAPADRLAKELSCRSAYVILTGDYAETLYKSVEKYHHVFLAPPFLRTPLASRLCYAAMDGEFVSADELNPDYLQITKAEKDLKNGTLTVGKGKDGT